MKVFWILFPGALFAAAAYFGMFHGFAAWYGPRYIRSDNDIGDLIMISLGVCCLAFMLGGWGDTGCMAACGDAAIPPSIPIRANNEKNRRGGHPPAAVRPFASTATL
ncbi:hypothetical protein [Paracidovorax oryzae]|uniref:hypothetical protein n=1 Tax=Paracidovorax oryzae TaxID=862720 RepID=UPI00030805E8|nr:hypothetical protein [Paracidovorax oryzae]